MIKTLRLLLVPALLFSTGVVVQAQSLPGKTLSSNAPSTRAGIVQPAKNIKSVVKGVSTPTNPFEPLTLRQLLVFARANHPDLYRQAIKFRRIGFTQDQTELFLETAINAKESA